MNAILHTCATPLEWLAADLAGGLSGIDDRAQWELANGDVITVTLKHDQDRKLEDSDYFGSIQWVQEFHSRGQRPADMDGNAEVVMTEQRARCWWQPPADVKRTDEHFASLRSHVRGWFRDKWSYCGIVVEVKGDRRSLDRDGSLWGIESNSDAEYFAEVIADLLAECNVTNADISAELEPSQ